MSNSSLSLEDKKRKILKSLCRLEASGLLRPPHSHQQILQMIAQVTNHQQTGSEAVCRPWFQTFFSLHRTSANGVCSASAGGRSFRS